jgi:transcriptional regulator with XRE-family HTH domain
MALLGQMIKTLRIEKKLTLKDLSNATANHLTGFKAIPPATISRLENDLVQKPKKEILERLALALNIPEDRLFSLLDGKRKLNEDESSIHIGYAFCTWSAPVIINQSDDKIPGKVDLYASRGHINNGSELSDPIFVKKNQTVTPTCKEERQLPVQSSSVITYTANELLRLLDNDKVDCIVAAGRLVQSRDDYIRITSIMSTEQEGCTLVVATEDK